MRLILFSILCLAIPFSQADALDKPEGNYKKTCRNELLIGPVLEAQCERRDGGMATSMINFWNCDDRITNEDGVLTCKNSTRRHLPGGSYKDSCRHIRMHHHKLKADCRTRDGEWNHSSINVEKCYGSVENDNGKLRCN